MLIEIVRYASGLSHDEVAERFAARSDHYREVPGLRQKYYVRFPDTDEYGGVYVWDSAEDLQRWRDGGLAGSLPDTYRVQGEPRREQAEVMLVLHNGVSAEALDR